jgi:hypothetical protein
MRWGTDPSLLHVDVEWKHVRQHVDAMKGLPTHYTTLKGQADLWVQWASCMPYAATIWCSHACRMVHTLCATQCV